jgi:hypothetical protein
MDRNRYFKSSESSGPLESTTYYWDTKHNIQGYCDCVEMTN